MGRKTEEVKVVIIAGSEKDKEHVEQIVDHLSYRGLNATTHYCSAHKEPRRLLDILEKCDMEDLKIIFVTVAGLSNALSGMVAANTTRPVLACPPFASSVDYLIDIHSTLRMPSDSPVLTVIGPYNCAQAVLRLTNLAT